MAGAAQTKSIDQLYWGGGRDRNQRDKHLKKRIYMARNKRQIDF